jgi:S1-C subfamily serine protease
MTTIGRSRGNTFRIDDESVSGNHARLEKRGEKFWICDESSTNGTYLNGRRIGEALLSKGDKVRFGEVEFEFDGVQIVRHSGGSPGTHQRQDSDQPTRRRTFPSMAIWSIPIILAIGAAVWFLAPSRNRDNTLSLAQATVLIMVVDGDDELCGFGSGFFVRDSRTVATNHHVIASIIDDIPGEIDCKNLVVGLSDESGLRIERFYAAKVLRFDEVSDVALLEVLDTEGLRKSPMTTRADEPRLGDAIRIFGYPGIGGVSLTVTDGFLGGVDESQSVPFYKTASQIAGGNSGGPVVDKNGRVIGIAAARYADADEVETIGLIIPIRFLTDLLEKE